MDWPSRRISLVRIFAVATAFGIFSGLQAYNYITLFTDRKQPFHILLALNITYWYAWAVLVPGMLWMARRYRFGRHTWKRAAKMHVGGVIVFTLAHALLWVTCRVFIMKALAGRDVSWTMHFQELFFLNFDWEMMTYWAVVGLSHALDFHRESQERELTAAQLRTRLAEANLQALQRQLHPHFLFNTLHTISALMHRDTDAADAMLERLSDLLRLTLDRIGTQQVTLKDELDFLRKYLEIEQTRFGERLHGAHRRRAGHARRGGAESASCSRSSRTRFGTASGRRSAAAAWTSAPAAKAPSCGWRCATTAWASRSDAFNTGVGLTQHAVASRAPVRRPLSLRVPHATRRRAARDRRHPVHGRGHGTVAGDGPRSD